MTEPTMGRRWADDGPPAVCYLGSSSAHRRPIGGPSSANCRRWAIGYQLVMPSVAHRRLPPVAHRRSRRWADDGPPAACYLGGDWPGSSDPGLYSDAFNFHDWGRDLGSEVAANSPSTELMAYGYS